LRPSKKKSNDKAVFFLHIPKCAGTTLTEEIIKKKFKPHESIIFYEHGTQVLIDHLKGMSQKEQGKIKCIAGHFAFGIHRYYTAGPAAYITLLRDPIERVISHYYYVLRREDHYLHQTAVGKKLTLKEYMEDQLSIELNNGQTRVLAGIGWGAPYGKCPDSMLEQAKKNVKNHFAAVGVSEQFDEFLQILNQTLGWRIPDYKKKNVSFNRLKKQEIDPQTLNTIEQYNRLDLELYRYAVDFCKYHKNVKENVTD
jgi:hypothetical protein